MADNFIDFYIDPSRIERSVNPETRTRMNQMLEFTEPPSSMTREKGLLQNFGSSSVQNIGLSPPANINLAAPSPMPTQVANVIPALMAVIGRILQELENNLSRLLSLNPSRREGIADHLDHLAGLPPHSATHSRSNEGHLHRWVAGPRSLAQNAALHTYFEEVALVSLGQAIVLKSWADRGIRAWSETDLGRLNWALSTTLRPHIPLDREGWQITRPNLYSWYNPSPTLQHEIWIALDPWRITDEGPQFLLMLLGPTRKAQSEVFEPSGYDSRFFKSLWEHMSFLGLDTCPEQGALKRNKIAFSPTLRDGSLVRSGPPSLSWIGLEPSSFQLILAELMQIWWGPAAPPFWSIGTGLEVHTKDQLALALGSPKPSVLSRIAEMEACDFAFVLEEQTIRAQGRNPSASRFRELVEKLPYFKRIRSSGTSFGDLQACVALSKLRPGGVLFWAREEALCPKDGHEMLNFLLERAKLVSEWDFSELEHSLPASLPLFPKHLYFFQKEPNLESRLSHRPVKHSIQGQLRSHVELSLVLADAFQVDSRPQPRGHWTILSHISPTPQRDWIEKWPDPTSHQIVRRLDQLRTLSLPLANFTTVRPTPEGEPGQGGAWSVHLAMRGFWLTAEYDSEGRKLVAKSLPRTGQEIQGNGFLVILNDETWSGPLSAYLVSDLVKKWLDCHAERRGDRWIINEQVIKWIPVPKALLCHLGVPTALENHKGSPFGLPLPGEWERLTAEVSYQPLLVKEALEKLPLNEENERIHAAVFVRTSRALDFLQSGQNRLLSMVTSEGRVRWRELMDVLPKGECTSLSLHPRIRLSGSLPPHLPIGKIDRVKSPSPGILLATESGFSLHIGSESSLLITLLWEQLEGITHPTWSELLQFLRLPRKIELAETTALDVLRSHGEQIAKLKELRDLLAACQLF